LGKFHSGKRFFSRRLFHYLFGLRLIRFLVAAEIFHLFNLPPHNLKRPLELLALFLEEFFERRSFALEVLRKFGARRAA